MVAVVAKRKAKKDPSVFSASPPISRRVIGITLLGRFRKRSITGWKNDEKPAHSKGLRNLLGLDRLLIGINRNIYLVIQAIQASAFFSCMWVASRVTEERANARG